MTTVATQIAANPPLPVPAPFTQATTLKVLVVVEGKPRCEPWTIVPGGASPNEGTITAAWTVGGVPHTLATHYVLGDKALRFDGFNLAIDGKWAKGTTCEEERLISWDGDELAVDAARWFASPDACEQAIGTGRPVAMDSDCFESLAEDGDDLRAPKTRDTVRARSLTRFKQLLRKGGNLYVVDEDDRGQFDCKPIKVAKGDGRRGGLSWIDDEASEDGERMRVNASIQLYDRPTRKFGLDVSVPDDYGVTYQEAFTSQGSESLSGDGGYALGCGRLIEVRGVEGAVSIHGNVHYFARSACKKAIARERARRRWFPAGDEGDEDGAVEDQEPVLAGGSFGPGIGGC